MSMKKLAKYIRKRLRTDRDLVVLVTGDEGEGKSRFVLELCKLIDPSFRPSRNIAYRGRKDIAEKLNKLPKYSAIDIDEAMKDFYTRDAMTSDRKKLNTFFSVIRPENMCYFLIIPSIWAMETNFRNHRSKIWIHIARRGVAVVTLKSMNQCKQDKYSLSLNDKILDKYINKFGNDIDGYLRACSYMIGHLIAFEYEVTDDELWNEYLEEKRKYLELEKNLEDDGDEIRTYKLARLVAGGCILELKNRGMSYPQIQKMLENLNIKVSKNYFSVRTKEVVKNVKKNNKS